jgi:hypothetical protein
VKLHDVLYLLTIRAPRPETVPENASFKWVLTFTLFFLEFSTKNRGNLLFSWRVRERMGVIYARGCEVFEVLDEGRNIVDERQPITKRVGHQRTFRVWLDCNQYQQDICPSLPLPPWLCLCHCLCLYLCLFVCLYLCLLVLTQRLDLRYIWPLASPRTCTPASTWSCGGSRRRTTSRRSSRPSATS